MTKTKLPIILEITVVYLAVLALAAFSSHIVALGGTWGVRMVLSVAVYAAMAAVPLLAMAVGKIPLKILGFSGEKVLRQLLLGLGIFAVTFTLFVLLPLLAGASRVDVLSFKASTAGVLIFYVFYDLFCVGLGEELVFRGYLYGRLRGIAAVGWLPMAVSAVLFGFLHYPGTLNFLNVAVTTLLGLFYSLCRWKLRGCSLLSLALGHGLHDAAIILLSYFLLT